MLAIDEHHVEDPQEHLDTLVQVDDEDAHNELSKEISTGKGR
jgi:hypothetical protein